MAGSTFEVIASYTVTSATNNIVMSNIPQTYTDLVILGVARITSTASQSNLKFNDESLSAYGNVTANNNGGTGLVGAREFNRLQVDGPGALGSTTTADWFAPNEYHIMNYTSSTQKKNVISFGMSSDNGSTLDYCGFQFNVWNSTAPITKITFVTNGTNFAVGSGWTLYGIRGK